MKKRNKLISFLGLFFLGLQGCSPLDLAITGYTVGMDNLLHRKPWKHDEIITNSAYLVKKDNKGNFCFTLEYVYYRRDNTKISPATLEIFHKDKKVLEKETFVEMKLQQGSAFRVSIPIETTMTHCIKLPVRPKIGETLKFDVSTKGALATATCKVGEIDEKVPCDHTSFRKPQTEEEQNKTIKNQENNGQTTS